MSETAQHQTCPRCGSLADNFFTIDTGMRLTLQEAESLSHIPDRVCPSCYQSLTSTVNQGLKLRLEQSQREKNKMMMWKSRVNLIKHARALMEQKAYSEAAVQYEKYLRVLEIVYNVEKNALTPEVFGNSARSREMTVLASVYWDLVRIYDSSPRYGDRMQRCADKLAMFLPYSSIYPDLVKKIESFIRTCKNPVIVRSIVRNAKARKGPCFIADAAFSGDENAIEPLVFRKFRDQYLRPSPLGRKVIWCYYRLSPPLAHALRRNPWARNWARWALRKLAERINKSL